MGSVLNGMVSLTITNGTLKMAPLLRIILANELWNISKTLNTHKIHFSCKEWVILSNLFILWKFIASWLRNHYVILLEMTETSQFERQ